MKNGTYSALRAGMAVVIGFSASVSQAALPDGVILTFNPGVVTYDSYGNIGDVASGSYFAVDLDGNRKFSGREKTPIEMHDGIILGISQPANPNAPGIDVPWYFFGIQGVISTSSPVSDNGDGTLDFSGWGVNWNGIDIDIGDTQAYPVPDTLRATIQCSNNPCQIGDNYMLNYFGHVPMGHPSGFGGVWFRFYLEGTISDGVLPARVAINVAGGTTQECTSYEGATVTASANVSLPADDAVESIEWLLNGEPVGSGEQIVQTLAMGSNSLEVQLQTQAGLTASASSNVVVRDTQPPQVSAAFIDARTGEQVTHVDKNSHIRIEARATDACDPSPHVQAMIGAPMVDGNVVAIQVERDRVSLSMPQMILSVTAGDASGNTAAAAASLTIGN